MKTLEESVRNKRILFITTKDIEYIRNTQEYRLISSVASGVEVVYSNKHNYIIRIVDVWRRTTRSKVRKADAIFVGFEPQFVIPYIGHRFKDKPIYIDFFISVYDTLIWDRKKFKDGSLLAKYFHHMDTITIKLSDLVVTDTKSDADYFIEEFHGERDKFETIYLEADSTIYYPREKCKSVELQDKFVVFYFGSILPLQGINIILDAIRKMKDDKDVFFDIVGPIPAKYSKPIRENVRYTEWLSQVELAERISQADLCLAGHFNKDIAKASRTIAGKTYIYEMMEKKMVLGDNLANRELFTSDDYHIFVEMNDSIKLVKVIKEQMHEKNRE